MDSVWLHLFAQFVAAFMFVGAGAVVGYWCAAREADQEGHFWERQFRLCRDKLGAMMDEVDDLGGSADEVLERFYRDRKSDAEVAQGVQDSSRPGQ